MVGEVGNVAYLPFRIFYFYSFDTYILILKNNIINKSLKVVEMISKL